MAFPTTPVLDAFERADENPIVGNWTSPMIDNSLRLLAGMVQGSVTNQGCSSYWNVAQFTDAEAYVTIGQKATGNTRWLQIGVRVTNPGATYTGYTFYFTVNDVGTDTWVLNKTIAGTPTTLASGSREFATGEKIGLEANGTAIKAHVYSGGSWSQLASVVNGDIPGAGYIGLRMYGETINQFRGNDFGGGEIVAAAAATGYGARTRARTRRFFLR